jgi:hypothetical protein
MKVFLQNSPKTRIALSLTSLACGGAIIGLCSPIIVTNVEFFYGFGLAFSTGGGDPAFSTAAAALLAAAAGGGLMVASSFFGLAGHLARSQGLLVFFLVLTCIGSLVAVIGGGIFLQVPVMTGESIYIVDTNSISPPLAGVQRDMNDFELAIHNECCVAKQWSSQSFAGPCTGNNDRDCPAINDTLVTDNIKDARILLCSCASSAQRLAAFQTAIRATGFCRKAQKATINTVDLQLPSKVPGNLKLSTITFQRYPITYTAIPLVGFNKIAAENPDQIDAAANPLPFGCGLGYQKGIAWMTDLWFQQNAVPSATGSLAIGLVNIGLLVVGITISLMQDHEAKEFNVGKVDKWDHVKDIPANFAHTGMPPLNMQAYGQQQIVTGYHSATNSEHNSANGSANGSVANSGINDKAQIFELLRDFYAKYDKNKSLSDVEDVATWTVSNGMSALNAKLMAKYNADLTSIPSSGSSTGLGAKALQNDLDI